MYTAVTRVLTILHLLHGRPDGLRGEEIAAELEVDTRTVRRYITMLRDLGVPVEGEMGCYGRYFLPPRYPLPPTIFSADELQVILGALQQAGTGQAADSAARKIKTLLR